MSKNNIEKTLIEIQITESDQETIALSFERSYDMLFKERMMNSRPSNKQRVESIKKRAILLIEEIQYAQERMSFSDIYFQMLNEFADGIKNNILTPSLEEKNCYNKKRKILQSEDQYLPLVQNMLKMPSLFVPANFDNKRAYCG